MYIMRSDKTNVGEFVEVSYGKVFTYRLTHDVWALNQGYKHEVDVLDGVRYANVKQTVAYVCVDEQADGTAVIEKWNIKQHRLYNQ
jgi:hypothetical protein